MQTWWFYLVSDSSLGSTKSLVCFGPYCWECLLVSAERSRCSHSLVMCNHETTLNIQTVLHVGLQPSRTLKSQVNIKMSSVVSSFFSLEFHFIKGNGNLLQHKIGSFLCAFITILLCIDEKFSVFIAYLHYIIVIINIYIIYIYINYII